MDLNVIIAYNGDQLANEAQMASANDNIDDLARLNQRIQQANGILRAWVESHGGQAIAQTGNGGRLKISASHLHELESILDQYRKEARTSVSVGVGAKLSDAEKALEYSVLRGGDSIELFTPELEARLGAIQNSDDVDLYESYLDKAEPALNKPSAGGGMTGPSQSAAAAPDQPQAGEGSEHSENEALQGFLASQPAPAQTPDLSSQFEELADASESGEQSKKDEADAQAEGDAADDEFKQGVVSVLKEFKEQAPLWEQLKEAEPDAYKTLADMMQVMIDMAKKMYGDGNEEEEPVQKSELPVPAPLHGTVEGFMGALKALPKDGPHRGKLITQHMNHTPFLQALQTHPQGPQVHSTLTAFLNSKANAGIGVGAKVMAKRSKNVREQTRNITDDQAGKRLAQYGEKVGIHVKPSTDGEPLYSDDVTGKPTIHARPNNPTETPSAFPVGHEMAHILNMPTGVDVETHQQWMDNTDGNDGSFGHHPAYKGASRRTDENVSTTMGALVARRAGVAPKHADPDTYAVSGPNASMSDKYRNVASIRMKAIDSGQIAMENGRLWPKTGLSALHSRITSKMAKVSLNPLKPGTTGRHQVVLPPNSQIDPSPSAGRKVSRIKILDPETQKTKWRQVRAGMVMAPDGTPTSSRNPSGGKE